MRVKPCYIINISLFITLVLTLIHGIFYTVLNSKENTFLNTNYLSKVNATNNEDLLMSLLSLSFQLPDHKRPGDPPNYSLVNPISRILGPSAKNIAINGGHCGRRARLLIALLHEKSIDARKVHLINKNYKQYDHSHEYVHAVVEANINGKWVIADPLYNIVYINESGQLAGLDEIQASPKIFNEGILRADEKYVEYFIDLYTYDEYRKFYWNSLPLGDTIYLFLAEKLDPLQANNLYTPYILEKPYLFLALLSYVLSFIIFILLLLANRSRLMCTRLSKR